jgi:5-methylcytosine-specific restriction endonuclease McrA
MRRPLAARPSTTGAARGSSLKQRTLLAIIATDATFERATHRDGEAWVGKCLHCNAHLVIGLDGEPVSRATIEHILPQCHGGTNDLANLGIACARCNSEKGVRHDHKRRDDPRLVALVAKLTEKRRARWRDPVAP